MDGLQSCKLAPRKNKLCLTSKQYEKRKSLLIQRRLTEMQFLKDLSTIPEHCTSPVTIQKLVVSKLKPRRFNIFFGETAFECGHSVKIAYIPSIAIIFAQFQVPELFYSHNSPFVLYCILIAYKEKILKIANPVLGGNSHNGHKSVLFYPVSQQGTIAYTKRDLDH